MDPSLKDLTDQIDEATALLLQTAGKLSDEQLQEPSLLPGWSRGYVLGHIARSANALRDMLDTARTGAESTATESSTDLRESAAAFRAAVDAMPAEAWATLVPLHKPLPASEILIVRLVEIELHHVDLDAGYQPSDWPTTFNELQLKDPQRQWRADRLV